MMDVICKLSSVSLRNIEQKLHLLADLKRIEESDPSREHKLNVLDAIDDLSVSIAAHVL